MTKFVSNFCLNNSVIFHAVNIETLSFWGYRKYSYNIALHRRKECTRRCQSSFAALIYEHVTRNVNSTDLIVNNACVYPHGGIYLSRSIKFILAGCAVV